MKKRHIKYDQNAITAFLVVLITLATFVLHSSSRKILPATDNGTHDRSPSIQTSSTQSPSIQCMLELEKLLYPLIYTWYDANLPVVMSVKIMNNKFYVLAHIDHVFDQDVWREGVFHCNGVKGGRALSSIRRPGKPTLIIECPTSVEATKDELYTVSMTPKGGWIDEMIVYDVKKMFECEKIEIENFPQSPARVKIGGTATVKGGKKIRQLALQWAEYHHLLGIDHLWIYINEEWNDGRYLPKRKYITWVPFNFGLHNYENFTNPHHDSPMEFFRVASQNDALWRARRMELDWLALTDIDEYIQVLHPHNSVKGTANLPEIGALPFYLASFDDDSLKRKSLLMNSIPYGRNVELEEENTPKPLLMDYVWRKSIANDVRWSRYKVIVNVEKVTSVNIHFVGGGDNSQYKIDANELRINHYKNPHIGVYNTYAGLFKPSELGMDTTLRDTYHDLVAKL